MTKALDIVAIGNAIVDVISQVDDAFLADQGLIKGSMTLIDDAQVHALYDRLGPTTERSGGSAANTVAGAAILGARTGFVGKVRNDQLGEVFAHDIRAAGCRFETPPALEGPATARSLIMVTPDAERTMATYLGVSTDFCEADLSQELIASAEIVYLEGYLWDKPAAKAAFRKAAKIAQSAGAQVALTLSDSFCVHRHRDSFLEIIRDDVDILFANEAEVVELFQGLSFDEAAARLQGIVAIAALTRSEKGSVVVTPDWVEAVPTAPVTELIDTTGAGDLYAAGFLYGLSRGEALAACARMGNVAAGTVIQKVGARIEGELVEAFRDAGLT